MMCLNQFEYFLNMAQDTETEYEDIISEADSCPLKSQAFDSDLLPQRDNISDHRSFIMIGEI
jgi:hypothetical protein